MNLFFKNKQLQIIKYLIYKYNGKNKNRKFNKLI